MTAGTANMCCDLCGILDVKDPIDGMELMEMSVIGQCTAIENIEMLRKSQR